MGEGDGPPKVPGTPSYEAFKAMMDKDVDPNQLDLGEQVQAGLSKSWVNPAYWNRQFVVASHVANNVPNGSVVLELGKDAKHLYYLNSPKAATLVVPPSNQKVAEGPIREAAVKLGVPFSLYTETPLDTLPLQPNSFDAALIFDMLDGAPEQAAAGAVALLTRNLKPNGRLLFVERSTVGLPQLAREYGGCSVDFETEGGFDVGIATRRMVGKASRKEREAKSKKAQKQARPIAATSSGFGAGSVAARGKLKKQYAKKPKNVVEEYAAQAGAVAAGAVAAGATPPEVRGATPAVAKQQRQEETAREEAIAEENAVKAAREAEESKQRAMDAAKAKVEAKRARRAAAQAPSPAAPEPVTLQDPSTGPGSAIRESGPSTLEGEKPSAEMEAEAEAEAKKAKAMAEAQAEARAKAQAAKEATKAKTEEEAALQLLRREMINGEKLSSQEDAFLDRLWAEREDMMDRIDALVETEKAKRGQKTAQSSVSSPSASPVEQTPMIAEPPPTVQPVAAAESSPRPSAPPSVSPQPPPEASGKPLTALERLRALKELFDNGMLTEDEFEAKRREILRSV
jgi:ubiquinone/menaquinone biosynthesis C-methylase UbiE